MAEMVKNLLAMQETQLRFLGWEDQEWLSTPVFLPGEFHGQRCLADYSPWSHKNSDVTEQPSLSLLYFFSVSALTVT